MLVTGVVKTMTAESAQRAALGAGAIVVDVVAVDDGRQDHQRVAAIRALRPDMILMSGGTEGGRPSTCWTRRSYWWRRTRGRG